jgi:hypothetical protein
MVNEEIAYQSRNNKFAERIVVDEEIECIV